MQIYRAIQELKNLDSRRRTLGMSYSALARKSGVSMPTVQRILSGKHRAVSFTNVLAIAEALGIEIHFDRNFGIEELREREAQRKAIRLVNMVQATSGLEGQAVGEDYLRRMVQRTVHELLAGSKRRLWGE